MKALRPNLKLQCSFQIVQNHLHIETSAGFFFLLPRSVVPILPQVYLDLHQDIPVNSRMTTEGDCCVTFPRKPRQWLLR